MVAKLVLEIHALCNKNEISMLSSQKCNVTNHGFAHILPHSPLSNAGGLGEASDSD